MLVLLVPFFFLVGLVASVFYIPSRRTYEMMKKLPGPRGLPIIGLGYALARTPFEDLFDFLAEISELPGRVKSFWVTGLPVVILCEPQDYEAVLKTPININKGVEYDTLRWTLNDGLIISDAVKWRQRRRLLAPAFINHACLEMYAVIINRNARTLTENLLGQSQNERVDIFSWVSRCTLDIICESVTGITLETQNGQSAQFTECLNELSRMLVERVKNPLYRSNIIFWLCRGAKYRKHVKFYHDFTQKVVNKRKQERIQPAKHSGKFKTILDTLIDVQKDQGNLKDSDIREEVNTFLREGHHTMARALSFCVYSLALHPNILDDLYEEQVEIFGTKDAFKEVKIEDLVRMKCLDRCIKETLRLYPPYPYFSRRTTEDVELSDGTVIPSGVNLLMIPYLLHRNPRLFPRPDKFDPSRFTIEDTIQRHPYAYLPFSGGPRNCIGQKFAILEMKIVLSYLIRSVEFEATAPLSTALKVIPSIVLAPSEPIMVKVTPR